MMSMWHRLETNGQHASTSITPLLRPAVRLELEVLEDRLVPSAFGVPEAFIDPTSSAEYFQLNAQGLAVRRGVITHNETDLFTFVAPVTGTYRIATTTAKTSSLDTVLGVYDGSGQRIAFNDDVSPFQRDSQVFVSLPAGQRFFISVTNYVGSPGGNYKLMVEGERGDDLFERNNSRTTAFDLGTLTEARTLADLVLADACDFYRFSLPRSGTASDFVRIQFNHDLGDLDMALFNAAGKRLQLANGVTNSETISLDGLSAGTYFLRVFGYKGARNPHYHLTFHLAGADHPHPTPTPAPTPVPGAFQIDLTFNGLSSSQIVVFQQAAARWQEIIVGDLPDVTFHDQVIDDIVIHARVVTIDGPGGVLGQAGPTHLRTGSRLPFRGIMEFDAADMAMMQADGTLFEVILHEMGHVLGIGTIWSTLGLVAGAGTSNSRFVGAQATAEFNALFGTTATGVPLEFRLGAGSNDSHWHESLFGNELMSPLIGSAGNPISRITVASRADLGYTVNMAAADPYTPPGFTSVVGTSSTDSGGSPSLVRSNGCGCPSCRFFQQMALEATDKEAVAPAKVAESLQADWTLPLTAGQTPPPLVPAATDSTPGSLMPSLPLRATITTAADPPDDSPWVCLPSHEEPAAAWLTLNVLANAFMPDFPG